MTQSGEYYQQYWSSAGFNPRHLQLPASVLHILQSTVPMQASCLDIGCGDGSRLKQWVKENNVQYLGVDISKNAIEATRRNGLDALLIEDATSLPFDNETFDSTLCFEVLEHLFDPLAVARESYRVLKPGGVFIATVPNALEIRRRIQFARGIWNPYGDDRSVSEPWRDPHIRFFSLSTLESMVRLAGFESVVVGHHFNPPLPKPSLTQRIAMSRLYRRTADRFPSLLGTRLHVVATKGRDDKRCLSSERAE